MKYDCSKTLDYVHERKRMCDYFVDQKGVKLCYKCPLQGLHCTHVCKVTPDHIDGVQTWSDTHPEKTREEAFLEIFPKYEGYVIDNECFETLVGKECCRRVETCVECWKEPYAGEFEKAREEE